MSNDCLGDAGLFAKRLVGFPSELHVLAERLLADEPHPEPPLISVRSYLNATCFVLHVASVSVDGYKRKSVLLVARAGLGITLLVFVSAADTVGVVLYPKYLGESVSMTELGDRLEEARQAKGGIEEGWTNREIARKAGISSPTVDRMFNGEGRPKVGNLDAVADVLGIPRKQARKLAGLPTGADGPYEGPDESRLLDVRQRKALDELIRSIVAADSAHKVEPRTGVAKLGGKMKALGNNGSVQEANDGH